MKKRLLIIATLMALSLIASGISLADSTHGGHGKSHTQPAAKMEHTDKAGTFEHKMVDQKVRAEFQIMSLDSMNMTDPEGATHHIMVKLFHDPDNHPIGEAVGKVKVIGPDKSEQTNALKNYNGIFAANFTFKEKGNHAVICLVNADGKKLLFKFWYPYE